MMAAAPSERKPNEIRETPIEESWMHKITHTLTETMIKFGMKDNNVVTKEAKGIEETAILDEDFDTPEPIGSYTFLQGRVTNVKSQVETNCKQTFTTFKAIKFIKKGLRYTVRVDCGGGRYIDVRLNQFAFTNYNPINGLNDPLKI